VIYFTDRRWDGTSFQTGSSEGTLTWTVPTGGLKSGTLVSFDRVNESSVAVSAERDGPDPNLDPDSISAGTVSRSGGFDLEGANEVIYAYTGSASSPTFLAAVANQGFNTSNGVLPSGLTVGVTALDLQGGADFGVYDPYKVSGYNPGQLENPGATTFDSRAAMLSAVNDRSRWTILNTSADDSGPYVPFLTDPGSPIDDANFLVTTPPGDFEYGDNVINPAERASDGSVTFRFTAPAGSTLTVTFDAGGDNVNVVTKTVSVPLSGTVDITLTEAELGDGSGGTGFGPLTITAVASDPTGNYLPSASTVIDTIDNVPCFLPGTHIATPSGEVAVETLQPGDLVLTADGRAVPLRFLGRRTAMPRFLGAERSNPIRIQAGALAENVPARDLYVSPNHGIVVDGVLAIASALTNGTTITQVPGPGPHFVYYSIETEGHEVILAENCPVETFMDHVPRAAWDNYADYLALYPEEPQIAEMDLPHAKSHRQVPREVHARIAGRAAVLAPRPRVAA
jgi:hypothetical protein